MFGDEDLTMENLIIKDNNKMLQYFVNGFSHFLTLWIIHHNNEIHGYGIMKELNLFLEEDINEGHVKKFSSSKIYPILKKMEKDNLIEGKWQNRDNKQIKFYKTTPEGELLINHLLRRIVLFKENTQWKSLLNEIYKYDEAVTSENNLIVSE